MDWVVDFGPNRLTSPSMCQGLIFFFMRRGIAYICMYVYVSISDCSEDTEHGESNICGQAIDRVAVH